MTAKRHFTPKLFRFLEELTVNNKRPWFEANRDRYEGDLRAPALRFIEAFGPHLRRVSPHFRADPRPVGGSLFRIHRDVRFSKDKSPYKTHLGIHFRHELGKGAHAPGFYLHIDPTGSFLGVGIWRPEKDALSKIRDAIVGNPTAWKRARDAKRFKEAFTLEGDALKRPPRGYPPEHRFVEDLKRKDFIALREIPKSHVTSKDFAENLESACKDGKPFVRFLCGALEVPF